MLAPRSMRLPLSSFCSSMMGLRVLVSMMLRKSFSLSSFTGTFLSIPALSTTPCSVGTAATSWSNCSASVRSHTTCWCPSPGSSANVCSSRSALRPTATMVAPIEAHALAAARPIPDDAPVISIVLPSSENALLSFMTILNNCRTINLVGLILAYRV